MSTRDRVPGPAQVFGQILLHLGCRLERHRVQVGLPKAEVTKLFGTKRCLPITEATALVSAFNKTGNFAPREQVEADKSRVQALPVVVIRNKSGDVLRLRRKESIGS